MPKSDCAIIRSITITCLFFLTGGMRPENEIHVVYYNMAEAKLEIESTVAVPLPSVIKFGFSGFKIEATKWSAVCNKCRTTLIETRGVTSAFTK
jgi:hypothetical protein